MPLALTDPDVLVRYGGPASVPRYDRSRVRPGIVHLGVGGSHRAHQALYLDDLLATGEEQDWGIVGVGLLAADSAMRDALVAQHGLYTVLERGPGAPTARVVGSLLRYLLAPDDPQEVLTALTDPAIRIVTLTVTQAGYFVDPTTGQVQLDHPDVRHDLQDPGAPRTPPGLLLQALVRRRHAGTPPFTVLSCDNLQGNGEILRRVLLTVADAVDPSLSDWIGENVAFPSSMVDRITPSTSTVDRDDCEQTFGLVDAWPVTCEPFRQWVIEDHFPTGRPALDRVGVQLVPVVAPYERMKLRLLNASHQVLAYVGHLCGYTYVHEAMADPLLPRLLLRFMADEATPTLGRVPGIDLAAYRRTVVERLSNPGLHDTLARLSGGSATGVVTFLLPVVRDQLAAGRQVTISAAVVAACALHGERVGQDGGHDVVVRDTVEPRARARSRPRDPLAFLRDPRFAGMDADPRFTGPYRDALVRLERDGARATLEHLLRT